MRPDAEQPTGGEAVDRQLEAGSLACARACSADPMTQETAQVAQSTLTSLDWLMIALLQRAPVRRLVGGP